MTVQSIAVITARRQSRIPLEMLDFLVQAPFVLDATQAILGMFSSTILTIRRAPVAMVKRERRLDVAKQSPQRRASVAYMSRQRRMTGAPVSPERRFGVASQARLAKNRPIASTNSTLTLLCRRAAQAKQACDSPNLLCTDSKPATRFA